MHRAFLVSLVNQGVNARRTVLGFINDNNSEFISTYIKNKYNLTLGEQYLICFREGIEVGWRYATNKHNVDVYVDIIPNLED